MRPRTKVDGIFPNKSELPCVGIAVLPHAQKPVAIERLAVGPDVGVVIQLGHGEGDECVGGKMEAVFESIGFHGASLNGDCELLSIGT